MNDSPTPKHPLFSLLEKGAVDWGGEREALDGAPTSIQGYAACSTAISLKRIADALEEANVPLITEAVRWIDRDPHSTDYRAPAEARGLRVDVEMHGTGEIRQGLLADNFEWRDIVRWRSTALTVPPASFSHEADFGGGFRTIDDARLARLSSRDRIVVRHIDGREAEWLLGDAIDWSRSDMLRLKNIFAGWRPR